MTTDTLTGRELDRQVHILLGWVEVEGGWERPNDGYDDFVRSSLQYTHPDCRGLPLVLAWLREHGWGYRIEDLDEVRCILEHWYEDRGEIEATGKTLPEACCRAALKTTKVGDAS